MFSVATVILWAYIVQCKRDKITRSLPCLFTAVIGTTKITQKYTPLINYTVSEKRCHFIFDYYFRNSCWIFIILIPLETKMNTPESYVIYLLNGLMT